MQWFKNDLIDKIFDVSVVHGFSGEYFYDSYVEEIQIISVVCVQSGYIMIEDAAFVVC